ncbi:MAG: hypothetical protein RL226_2241 [Bacteroidota bacterium]
MRIVLILSIVLVFLGCNSAPEQVDVDMINFPDDPALADLPVVTFEEDVFDFGRIAEGEVVTHVFRFENTGKAPLVLTAVEVSCGCTAAKDWPKEPIAPGGEGTIEVSFNSNDKLGKQNKSITVISNARPSKTIITMRGEVVGPDNQNGN